MNEWNPELYLRFKSQRTQPAIDLISRIALKKPAFRSIFPGKIDRKLFAEALEKG